MPKKSDETILREALEIARDELVRVNQHYACVRPDPLGVVLEALEKVPCEAPIENAFSVERKIVYRIVCDLIRDGYFLTVNDGEDDVVKRSQDMTAIFAALGSTDMDTIKVSGHPNSRRSFVDLVWGNGADVIHDYGVSLEGVLKPALDLAEALAS